MPATHEEFMAWVHGLADYQIMPDTEPIWEDGTTATEQEMANLTQLVGYEIRLRVRATKPKAIRKAYRLLRRFLTPTQKAELCRLGEFTVIVPSGRTYRLAPSRGAIYEVQRHGKNWFAQRQFCIHPADGYTLPPADVTLSHLLLLSTDEAEFLKLANPTNRRSDQLWNGDYLRQMRAARRARENSCNLPPEPTS